MMYVDNPVFKEILWEWRAFAIKFDPNICRNILNLPLKDGKSSKMLDRYICRLGYDTNIKIRDKDLKIKNLHEKSCEGIERWTTEVYNFPISTAIFGNITKALNIDVPGRMIRDGQQLISILSKVTPSVQVRTHLTHFIEHHKDLEEGKYVKLLGWEGKDAAKIMISEAIKRYNKSIDDMV
jgi:hypothetical protein